MLRPGGHKLGFCLKSNGTIETIKLRMEPLGKSGAWVTRHIEGVWFKLYKSHGRAKVKERQKNDAHISHPCLNKYINFN